jgi:protein TonB
VEIFAGSAARTLPQIQVTIRPDGTLAETVLLRSSGDSRLDAAAIQILELAGPFPPLPEAMLAEYDVLRFSYDWDFSAGARPAGGVR